MLVLSSLVGANQEASYFQQLKGALGRGCLQYTTDNVASGSQDIFRATCSFVATTLGVAPTATAPNVDQALVSAFGTETPGLSTNSSCSECVQSIQDLESYLATNGTAQGIEDALALGCHKRFKDAQLTECLQNVDTAEIPQLIDYALANYPPATACTSLQRCP